MTAAFIEIIIRDEQMGHHMSHKELRLMYGMAIVRFVNGLVDREQKGKFARSIGTLARMMGLPPWFVDLRHASTHERLPSLNTLRDGAYQAVGWLHDNYWIRNLKNTEQKQQLQETSEIKLKLNEYKECRKNYIKDKYSGQKCSPDRYVECIQALLEMIDDEIIKEDIIPLLLGVGGLVPAGKKKRASADNMIISKGLVELWTPLLQGLDDGFPSFGEELITNMISKLTINYEYEMNETLLNPYAGFAAQKVEDPTKSSSYLLTIACWLRHFVQEFKDSIKTRTLSHISIDTILEGCLKNPNYYTRTVLQTISTIDPELGESIKPFTRYIDQIILKFISEKTKNKNIPLITAEDEDLLENELKELEAQLVDIKTKTVEKKKKFSLDEKMDIDDESYTGWKLYENWKPCPIGTLPNGKVPCLDMSFYAPKI
ncbi:Las1-like-domain-containing protein [Cokeromyces recurvatus]|uniref:Las1-like-domain-containing protein n=1 Tax=Cokeromyces recurvatus TaxID=90255 RepID=UPI002220AEC1|nr:Las1-like-domain-containing protein [Cokeromyces recurvatus]KAI7902107.1 Las1-like-domain-containing protein [Cokeromyces recurvatus]